MTREYRYDDFSLGQIFRSGAYGVSEAEIVAFARQYDPQPQHLSQEAAASSGFGELVASGWHTAAISMRLFITDALPPIAGGSQGAGVDRLAWPKPVRPGDRLHVRLEVLAELQEESGRHARYVWGACAAELAKAPAHLPARDLSDDAALAVRRNRRERRRRSRGR